MSIDGYMVYMKLQFKIRFPSGYRDLLQLLSRLMASYLFSNRYLAAKTMIVVVNIQNDNLKKNTDDSNLKVREI